MQETCFEKNAQLTWTRVRPTPGLEPKCFHSTILFKQYMIIIGGFKSYADCAKKKHCENIIIFDLENNVCHPAQIDGDVPLLWPYHTACLFQDNKIIIFGLEPGRPWQKGKGKVSVLSLSDTKPPTINCRNIQTTHPPILRCGAHTSHIYQNHLYVFDDIIRASVPRGQICRLNLGTVIVNTFDWSFVEAQGEAPYGNIGHCSVIHEDKMYVLEKTVGDRGQLMLKVKLRWETVRSRNPQSAPKSIRNPTVNEVNGKLYFFAGEEISSLVNDLYVYDIEQNVWECIEIKGDIPSPRTGHNSIHYKDKLVVFGGTDDESAIYYLELNDNQSYVTSLKRLFLDKTFADVVFNIEGQDIMAHRNILAVRCSHFRNIFEREKITSESSKPVICLQEIKLKTFKCSMLSCLYNKKYIALLEFIYCNEFQADYSLALDLLRVSHAYCFPELNKACSDFLGQSLTFDNLLEIANVSQEGEATSLNSAVIKFVIENIDQLKERNNLESLPKSMMCEIMFKLSANKH